MPVVNIKKLARALWELLHEEEAIDSDSLEFSDIGIKPGEKLYEELMTGEEIRRSLELESFFAVLPAFRGFFRQTEFSYDGVISDTVQNPYNSSLELALDVNEIKNFLKTNHVLEKFSAGGVKERSWPGVESLGVVLNEQKFSHKNSLSSGDL